MSEVSTDKVLDKVRKLMALAKNDGATEGERDNAMRMAIALLAKHNLDEADLEVTETREQVVLEGYEYAWARTISMSISELYFCKYYMQRGTKFKHFFVGKTSNATTAQLMSEYVIKSLRKEAMQQMRKNQQNNAWALSFVKGAGDVIRSRCKEMIAASANEKKMKGNGTEIVLASIYKSEMDENTRFINEELGLKLRTSNSRQHRAGNGYHDGADYGRSVGLNTQVSNSSQLRIGV
jgi:hypothetical protein